MTDLITETNNTENPMSDEGEVRVIPAGTILHLNGIPVALVEDTKLETHPENWPLALQCVESEDETPLTADLNDVSIHDPIAEPVKMQEYMLEDLCRLHNAQGAAIRLYYLNHCYEHPFSWAIYRLKQRLFPNRIWACPADETEAPTP